MVDTKRTLAALQALITDGGNNTAQEVRDFLVSVFPPQYVGAKVSDPAGANVATVNGTPLLITFDTENFDSDGFATLGADDDRLTIPAGMGGLYIIGGTIGVGDVTTAAEYKDARIYKNGVAGSLLTLTRAENGSGIVYLSVSVLDVAVATDYYSLAVLTEGNDEYFRAAHSPNLWLGYLGQVPA